jgi:hypothetical protein
VPVAAVPLVVLDGEVCDIVEFALWSLVVPVAAVPLLVLAGGFCAEVAFWSVVLGVPAALVEPLPTVLGVVWLLTGGVVG